MKYGPWRDALTAAWVSECHGREGVHDRAERAALIVKLLKEVCRAMDRVRVDAWVDNLGHNISHVSGPVPTMHRLDILNRAAAGHATLCYGKDGGRGKRLCVGRGEGHARALVGKVIELADEVGDMRAPRTCREWVEVQERVVAAAKVIKPPGMMTRTDLFCTS